MSLIHGLVEVQMLALATAIWRHGAAQRGLGALLIAEAKINLANLVYNIDRLI